MNERESVAHLLRRFGLGAGKTELDQYAPLGVSGALDRLLNFESQPDTFPITPWEYMEYEDGTYQLEPTQVSGWWALRMLLTQRPLEQRLTLLWHDHFSVSGEKVFDAPMMVDYLEDIRTNASGSFSQLLHAMAKSPALMFYLDTHLSTKFKPNENFAREVLELFTLGMGNYSEKDIQEAARAFTGWSLHFSGIGLETPFDELRQSAAKERRSVFSFCEVPDLHDAGLKSVLGKSGAFKGEQVLDLALDRPDCSKFIAKKLVDWFLGVGGTPALIEKTALVLKSESYQIKPALRSLAESPEFWSSECVRANHKSPVDFTIGLFRQLGVRDVLLQLRGGPGRIRKELKDVSLGLVYLMNQQGLLLLFPPNVGGWEWGSAWITATNMTARWNHAQLMFRGDDPNRPIAVWIATRLKNEFRATNPGDIVEGFLQIFDGNATPEQRSALVQIAQRHGVSALDDKDLASALFVELGTALFAMPSYHMC